jgi:MarR family transcriptional regulator, transcriptional regulator for hemolysin
LGHAISPVDNIKRSISLKLIVLARQLRIGFDHEVERVGVTRAQWTLIAAVARNPGATQRTIAAALEVTEVTAGRLVDRLCDEGYLERRENPSDRRGYRVYLTPGAKPVLNQLGAIAEVQENELFQGFDGQDLARLEALLDMVSHNLSESRKRYNEGKALDADRVGE